MSVKKAIDDALKGTGMTVDTALDRAAMAAGVDDPGRWDPLPGEEVFEHNGFHYLYVRNTKTGTTGYWCREHDLVYSDYKYPRRLVY